MPNINPDEAIEYALKNDAQGISLGLAKTLQADRDSWKSKAEAAEETAKIWKIDAEKSSKAWQDTLDFTKRELNARIECLESRLCSAEKERDEWKAKAEKLQDIESKRADQVSQLVTECHVAEKERDEWCGKYEKLSIKEGHDVYTISTLQGAIQLMLTTCCEHKGSEQYKNHWDLLNSPILREIQEAREAVIVAAKALKNNFKIEFHVALYDALARLDVAEKKP